MSRNADAARTRYGVIGSIPIRSPLTKSEEDQLHHEISAGRHAAQALLTEDLAVDDANALRRQIRRGRRAEEDLLAGTCALVKKRVTDLGFPFDQDELEAAGLEGLVRALREFDPEHGARFATYANYWISKMVFAAISHRVPYSESDIRLVIKFRRFQKQNEARAVHVEEVMGHLGLDRSSASRVMQMSFDIAAGMATIEHDHHSASSHDLSEPWPESDWVIDQLKEILGGDFTDFWMWTGRVMSLQELGERNGISKQAMAKRVQKWRRSVENSDHADAMLSWLRAQ